MEMNQQKLYLELLEEENRLSGEISELKVTLHAVQVLLKRYNIDSNAKKNQSNVNVGRIKEIIRPIEIKAKRDYPKRNGITFVQKVVDGLKDIGSGTANDVAISINKLYPDVDIDKAKDGARLQLSKLNGNGKVIGEKIEGKNTFLYTYLSEDYEDLS